MFWFFFGIFAVYIRELSYAKTPVVSFVKQKTKETFCVLDACEIERQGGTFELCSLK